MWYSCSVSYAEALSGAASPSASSAAILAAISASISRGLKGTAAPASAVALAAACALSASSCAVRSSISSISAGESDATPLPISIVSDLDCSSRSRCSTASCCLRSLAIMPDAPSETALSILSASGIAGSVPSLSIAAVSPSSIDGIPPPSPRPGMLTEPKRPPSMPDMPADGLAETSCVTCAICRHCRSCALASANCDATDDAVESAIIDASSPSGPSACETTVACALSAIDALVLSASAAPPSCAASPVATDDCSCAASHTESDCARTSPKKACPAETAPVCVVLACESDAAAACSAEPCWRRKLRARCRTRCILACWCAVRWPWCASRLAARAVPRTPPTVSCARCRASATVLDDERASDVVSALVAEGAGAAAPVPSACCAAPAAMPMSWLEMVSAAERSESTSEAVAPSSSVRSEPKSSTYEPLSPAVKVKLKVARPSSSVTLTRSPLSRTPEPRGAIISACTSSPPTGCPVSVAIRHCTTNDSPTAAFCGGGRVITSDTTAERLSTDVVLTSRVPPSAPTVVVVVVVVVTTSRARLSRVTAVAAVVLPPAPPKESHVWFCVATRVSAEGRGATKSCTVPLGTLERPCAVTRSSYAPAHSGALDGDASTRWSKVAEPLAPTGAVVPWPSTPRRRVVGPPEPEAPSTPGHAVSLLDEPMRPVETSATRRWSESARET